MIPEHVAEYLTSGLRIRTTIQKNHDTLIKRSKFFIFDSHNRTVAKYILTGFPYVIPVTAIQEGLTSKESFHDYYEVGNEICTWLNKSRRERSFTVCIITIVNFDHNVALLKM